MQSNKKFIYLGATLFSAMLLTTLSSQTAKAATTGDTTSTTTQASTAPQSTTTSSTTTTTSATPVSTASSTPTSSTTSTPSTTTSSTMSTPSTTTTAPSTATSSTSSTPSATTTAPSTSSTTGTTTTTPSTTTTTSTPTTSTTTTSPTSGTSTTKTSTTSKKDTKKPGSTSKTKKSKPSAKKFIHRRAESSSESSAPKATKLTKKPTLKAKPVSREKVALSYLSEGSKDSDLASMGVKATATLNGKLFYLVGDGEFIEASDYHFVESAEPGILRTYDKSLQPVDAFGQPLGKTLSPNTAWKYSRTVKIDGASYYQVASDEFVPVDDALGFTPVAKPTDLKVTKKATIYNSLGESTEKTLAKGSAWRTDGCAVINGVKMYRVSTDGWISATAVEAY
ncbi:SLAP domain-containing protein [Companilactobacillus zhachilii]|uniref:SLAP domain-containing protein n=1 Tax=Companilactobacillus zhachilii TaxID=2304606 RepID=UPI001923EEB2|nr:SLAP domain-containing protein [Companilactobacillus zhachilii]MBL3531383.1 SLAP domain-containing protein [Companilactobacillus zhachilii]